MPTPNEYRVTRLFAHPRLWVTAVAAVLLVRSATPFVVHGSLWAQAWMSAAGEHTTGGRADVAAQIYWTVLTTGDHGTVTAFRIALHFAFGALGLVAAFGLLACRAWGRLLALWLVGFQVLAYAGFWWAGVSAGLYLRHDMRTLVFCVVAAVILLMPAVVSIFSPPRKAVN